MHLPGCLFALVFASSTASAQPPPTQKQVPPAGINIPEADRAELEKGAEDLGAALESLRANPAAARLLPDVEIFHKGVAWALRYDEFLDLKQVAIAKALLAEGKKRAEELKAGKSSWIAAGASGPRGYVSRIDDSIQPYGIVVPADWQPGERKARPVLLWFHGRSENLTELAFVSGQMKAKAELALPGAFIINLYGRFCNASKFAGEIDAFEALEDLARRTPIDRQRIGVGGFSMGGASVWHMAAHHAGKWCAATPGAGFAETAIYAGIFKPGKTPPPWWEQVLWRWYDAPPYAPNFANLPIMAYSGETDPQKASADLMEKVLAEAGMKLDRLIGPKTGHKYEPGTKKELEAWLAARFAEGRKAVPNKVRHVTYTLRYNTSDWLTIDRLEKHWERAEANAEIADEGTMRIDTKNIAALSVQFSKPVPLDKARPPRVIIDGADVGGYAMQDDTAKGGKWTAGFCKLGGKWQGLPPDYGSGLHKRHGLQGPIDDAFLDRFIFVRPTGTAMNPKVAEWSKAELDRAIREWRRVFRGEPIVKYEKAVTKQDIANAHLVLWGDPASNSLLGQVASRLPLKWTRQTLELGSAKLTSADHAPILIHPNPLNPERYVVINSSFTFRMGSRTSNSLQTPKLPDWALIDLRQPANDQTPGLIYDAGFFNEYWKLP